MRRDEMTKLLDEAMSLLYDIKNAMPRGNEVHLPWQIERYLNKHIIADIDGVLAKVAKVNMILHSPGRL